MNILKLFGVNTDFEQLFYLNEYKTLSGEKKRIIFALIFILFLTFLALGYAIGSIQNLEKRMDNPFTNWVNLSIKSGFEADRINEIEETYSRKEKKEAFSLNDVRGWVNYNLEMYPQHFDPTIHSKDTLVYNTWGRDLMSDDPLWQMILSKKNLIWKDTELVFEEGEVELSNCEMIITESMLNRLKFDAENEKIGHILIREDNTPIFIKIVGVVKEMPRFCDFITSPAFYNIKTGKSDAGKECYDLMDRNKEGDNTFSFLSQSELDIDKFEGIVKRFFSVKEQPDIRIAEKIISGNSKFGLCEMSFFPSDKPTLDSIRQFISFSKEEGVPLSEVIQLECSDFDYCDELTNYHHLAFNFDRLGKVELFKEDLKSNTGVEIDMSQVEAKKNFALVSYLTMAISVILLCFGILSIILFVNSLLRSHLFKVRSNLGTCKAFGVSNQFLNTIYLKIIFSFLALSILVALGATIIVDRVEQFITLEESKFNIFSSWILIAIILLVLISLFISSRTIKQILGDTPGNLIYER